MDPMGIYSYIVDELKLSFLVRRLSLEWIVWVLNHLSMVLFCWSTYFIVSLFLSTLQIVDTYVWSICIVGLFIYVSLPFIWKCRSVPH